MTRSELDAAKYAIKLTALQIEKLKVELARLRRMKFGQSFERLTLLSDQLELTLEELEAEHAQPAGLACRRTRTHRPGSTDQPARRAAALGVDADGLNG